LNSWHTVVLITQLSTFKNTTFKEVIPGNEDSFSGIDHGIQPSWKEN